MKSVFFIPVFNQIIEFPRVLEELREIDLPCDTILLINNGSSDGSENLIRESGFSFLEIPQNLGIGYSYRLAVEWAIEHKYDILGGLAANGKMLPGEMHRVLNPILEGKADYVTGSRFLSDGASPNLPSFRKKSIPLVNYLVRACTGVQLSDSTCGYRAMRLSIMKAACFDWRAEWLNTYGFEYYIYAKVLLNRQWRWLEVPITMRYPPKGHRYSKIRPGRDWWAMLKPWIMARLDGKGFA